MKNVLEHEEARPAFVGNECNTFWNSFQTFHNTQQFFISLFGESKVETVLLQDSIKMFHLFQICRLEIAKTFTTHEDINQFKHNVKEWYRYVNDSVFLGTGKETVYAHIFANVIPMELEKWHEESGLGYGVFSMQGAEHVNKVTKQYMQGYTNHWFDAKCKDDSWNDSFVTILRISRWKFFVQHSKVHITDLGRNTVIKEEKFDIQDYHIKQEKHSIILEQKFDTNEVHFVKSIKSGV